MTERSKKHVLVLVHSLESARSLVELLVNHDVTVAVVIGQGSTQGALTFQLDDYDTLVRVFRLAIKRHGAIDQVVGFFPDGLQDSEHESDKASVSTLSLIAVWITKLATFYFRQSGKPSGTQGLVFVAPAPASKDNAASPLSAMGTNSLLGLMRSIQHQAFFEGFRFTIVYASKAEVEAGTFMMDVCKFFVNVSTAFHAPEQRNTAAAVIRAISQEDKFSLESIGKTILSDGRTIESQQTTMSGVEGYRKLGSRLVGAVALKAGIRTNSRKAARFLRATGLSNSQIRLGSNILASIIFAWFAWHGWIPSLAYMIFGVLLWKSFSSGRAMSQPFRTKKDGETCSTAVFLGSGGHTGEAIQLLSALDTTRYTPRSYIFCTGDNISLTKATSFENDLRSKSSGSGSAVEIVPQAPYRLVELPRARKVAQSYLSAVGTTLYSLLVTFWKLAAEPLVKGDLKRVPDLLIVNGPGTCVVVVLVYRLLKLLGQRSPQIIYVESFTRVSSLSLSGKILKNVVDEFIVQWPVEGYTGEKDDGLQGTTIKAGDPKLRYRGWLI